MSIPPDLRIVSSFKKFARISAWTVILISVLVLAGWVFDMVVLKSILPNWPAMVPISALCFICLAISFILYKDTERTFLSKPAIVGYLLSWIVIIISLLEVGQYYFELDLVWRNIFIKNGEQNKMAFFSAICFFFLGIALVAIRHRVKSSVLNLFTTIVIVLSAMGTLNYVFWANNQYDVFGYKSMGLHTSICFLCLAFGVLFSTAEKGWMAIVTSNTLGGKLIRKLVVRMVIVLLTLMEVNYLAKQYGYIDSDFAMVFSTIVCMILIFYILLRTATDLAHEDIKRIEAEETTQQINQKLTVRTSRLEASNEELQQVAYVAAHDLQEPLRTISTYSGLIYKKYIGEADKDTATYLKFLNEATLRMRTLVDDIRNYGRVCRVTTISECDCNKIVQEVLTDMKTAIAESHAKIEVSDLPLISCYPGLKLVFVNLINNALKYRKPDVQLVINISCESTTDKWLFTISDNGIGIEKEYTERIFQLFQRLHVREKYLGSGIGLAICKKVVEFHGGKIWVLSEIGKGSSFKFTISKTLMEDQ